MTATTALAVALGTFAAAAKECMNDTWNKVREREIADHIHFTDNGVIVEHGPPASFFREARPPRPRVPEPDPLRSGARLDLRARMP